jgi:hypothetical protein
MTTFRFKLGDTVFFAQGDTIRSGVVSRRTLTDSTDGSTIQYDVINPANTSECRQLPESQIFIERESVKEVLFAQENSRHEDAIRKIKQL